jgi:hypothetical protein
MAPKVGRSELIKSPMTNFLPTSRDYVFEVSTHKFDKVILDCASFITGLVFYNNRKELFNFYLGGDECQEMHDFLLDSHENKKFVCFEIEVEQKTLTISRKDFSECH